MTHLALQGGRLSEGPAPAAQPVRDVFIGCHSKVWQTLSRHAVVAERLPQAIGHRDVGSFGFTDRDRVWILSHSREPAQNSALLDRLRHAAVQEIVYVSSSSTIVSVVTDCYAYPRVKGRAEREALALPAAKVLTIGMMYEGPMQLPGGANVATSFDELAAFVVAPDWPEEGGRRKTLLRVVRRPFGSTWEHRTYRCYGRLLRWAGGLPCLLRPLDVVLRACGIRWYGYVYLSNRLWISTIS